MAVAEKTQNVRKEGILRLQRGGGCVRRWKGSLLRSKASMKEGAFSMMRSDGDDWRGAVGPHPSIREDEFCLQREEGKKELKEAVKCQASPNPLSGICGEWAVEIAPTGENDRENGDPRKSQASAKTGR